MCDYEENVKLCLGWESYEKCLSFCKEGKDSYKQIQEIASCLNPSIMGALRNQSPSVRENKRDSSICVMSKWYNNANKSAGALDQFNITRLIEVLRNNDVKQFTLAMEIEESGKSFIRSQ